MTLDKYRAAVQKKPVIRFKVRGLRLDFSGRRKHKRTERIETAYVIRTLKTYLSVVPVDVLADDCAAARLAMDSKSSRLAGFQRIEPTEELTDGES